MDPALNAVTVARRDLTADLFVLDVMPDAGVPTFEPGQFVRLGLPEGDESAPKLLRRAYSIASSPYNKRCLEFLITRVPEGRLSPRLAALNAGDRVWVEEQGRGKFTLGSLAPTADLLLVATGTGIAPFASMVRAFASEPRWRRLALFHGVRRSEDLAYRGEFEGLARDTSWLRYLPLASREPDGSAPEIRRGRVTQWILGDSFAEICGFDLQPANANVLLCGNPEMVKELNTQLLTRGFTRNPAPTGRVLVEQYW